jgi:hypothetical protein
MVFSPLTILSSCGAISQDGGMISECVSFDPAKMNIKISCGSRHKEEWVRQVLINTIEPATGIYKKYMYKRDVNQQEANFIFSIDSVNREFLQTQYSKIILLTFDNHVDYHLIMTPPDWQKKGRIYFTQNVEKY